MSSLNESLVFLYTSARESTWDVVCSIDDTATTDNYLQRRLVSAVRDATEILLLKSNVSVPADLLSRIQYVRAFCKTDMVPVLCDMLCSEDQLSRDDLDSISRTVDCWLTQLGNKYSSILKNPRIQCQVMACVC